MEKGLLICHYKWPDWNTSRNDTSAMLHWISFKYTKCIVYVCWILPVQIKSWKFTCIVSANTTDGCLGTWILYIGVRACPVAWLYVNVLLEPPNPWWGLVTGEGMSGCHCSHWPLELGHLITLILAACLEILALSGEKSYSISQSCFEAVWRGDGAKGS